MLNSKKATLFFLFLSSVALISFIFRVSEFSMEYKNNKLNLMKIETLEYLTSVINLITKEKELTLIYLKQQNKINFQNIEHSHDQTKLYLSSLLKNTIEQKNFKELVISLRLIMAELDEIKEKVDTSSVSNEYVINSYNINIMKSLTDNMGQLVHTLPLAYNLSLDKWLNRALIGLDNNEKVLLLKVKGDLSNRNSRLEREIFVYVLLSILFLFFILFFIFWSKVIKKHKVEVLATLKTIEEDLSDKQCLEIQEVLRKDDTLEVYKFLAKTIKEPNMLKDQFLANISHEVRTPLNGIMGFTTILQSTKLDEEQIEFLNIIEESSNSLLTIVNDILDFSTVSSGHLEVENIRFNLIEKIETIIESYAERATEKNIELGLYLDPELPLEVLGDPTRISQVLLNLLSNAVKFTPEKGMIHISIMLRSSNETQATIHFSVQDTGIGIVKNKQSQIFDAFSQADISTNRKFGGTGLGLTISSKFVELMGGKLELESEKGKGSTFYFDLLLDINKTTTLKVKPNFSELKVGYLLSDNNQYNQLDEGIKSYVSYTGAHYKLYEQEQLFTLSNDLLPDILLINHTYIQNENLLNQLLELPTKVVLISNSKINEFKNLKQENIYKVIFQPMNFTKMMNLLDVGNSPYLNNVLLYKESKLSGKIYSSILESLGYKVEIYYSIYEFKKQLETKKYKFALFDDKNTNNEIMSQIIKKNGAIPFLFSEEKGNNSCCQVLDYSIDANTLKEELKRA